MILQKINVHNFKSIEDLEFEPKIIDNSYTYSLLGINESGKSSILKALSLVDEEDIAYPNDFFDDNDAVIIGLRYKLTEKEQSDFERYLTSQYKISKELASSAVLDYVYIEIVYSPTENCEKEIIEHLHLKTNIIKEYTLVDKLPTLKSKAPTIEGETHKDFSLQDYVDGLLMNENYFYNQTHKVVLWKATSQYLVLDEIDLDDFSDDPKSISIPLLNCFILAGIKKDNIAKEIKKLKSPVAICSLQSKLSEITTNHIRKVWPEHPISITFQISDNNISLLVEDEGVKYQPKTSAQRSDGFKQFISFLLTISVENHNKELSNTILLIDEPETHLHPPAQLNLLKELIKITSNANNNILLFATHSNYLIDKVSLERNFKVSKMKNLKTRITQIPQKQTSYAEVNFEVFGIITTDYHNELYGHIELNKKELFSTLPKNKKWKNSKTGSEYEVCLPEYIRHSIHHPENQTNPKFTEKDLSDSIKTLIKLKTEIE